MKRRIVVSLVFLLAVHGLLLAPVYSVRVDVMRALPVLIGALIVVLGAFMGKVRPNWFIGIRTPWTLSSRRSWQRTHRLGGLLYVAGGFAMVISALGSPRGAIAAILLGVLVPSAIAVVYSWWVWRSDPDRVGDNRHGRPPSQAMGSLYRPLLSTGAQSGQRRTGRLGLGHTVGSPR